MAITTSPVLVYVSVPTLVSEHMIVVKNMIIPA